MSSLHVFNPWHDEALAAVTPYYTPTATARQIATSLAALPKLWAAAGDAVLLPQGNLAPRLGADGVWREEQMDARFWQSIHRIDPWGWDACLVHQLRRRGAPERLLPTDEELALIRQLSSRRTAVELLPQIKRDVVEQASKSFDKETSTAMNENLAVSESLVGCSAWCTSWDDVERAIADFGGTVYAKAPWSCSGRGVFVVTSPVSPTARRRLEATIKKQGAVEIEPAYERVQDFAMEFTVRQGRAVQSKEGDAVQQSNAVRNNARAVVHYEGLSLFETSPTGDYSGNLVAPEPVLLDKLPAALHPALQAVRQSFEHRLATLLVGHYTGPVGVDMMIVRRPCAAHQTSAPPASPTDSSLALHPCVELNLRRTMGLVALSLRRHLTSARPQFFFSPTPRNTGVSPVTSTTSLASPNFFKL